MNNRRILQWRSWSPARRGATLGALIGIVGSSATLGSALILDAIPAQGEQSFSYALGYLAMMASYVTTLPTDAVGRVFEWRWAQNFIYHPNLGLAALNVSVNSILLGGLGWLVGAVIRWRTWIRG